MRPTLTFEPLRGFEPRTYSFAYTFFY